MAEDRCKRIVVWVQHMGDRPILMLWWHDPVTGQRKSKGAKTCNPLDAEKARSDLGYEVNHRLYHDVRLTTHTLRKGVHVTPRPAPPAAREGPMPQCFPS
jgi:hypothetical protein